MTFEEFTSALADGSPPPGVPPLVLALWHDAKGNWGAAHEIAQRSETRAGAKVHAYLHRKEGDRSNARYWYARAGTEEFAGTLSEEWESLTVLLLRSPSGLP